MSRVIRTADPQRHGIELSLLRHVSPIEWDNIVLYGEYVLNRRLVRRTRSRPLACKIAPICLIPL